MRGLRCHRFGDEVDEAEAADSAVEHRRRRAAQSRPVLALRRWSAWLDWAGWPKPIRAAERQAAANVDWGNWRARDDSNVRPPPSEGSTLSS